jgi:hypothetical protein
MSDQIEKDTLWRSAVRYVEDAFGLLRWVVANIFTLGGWGDLENGVSDFAEATQEDVSQVEADLDRLRHRVDEYMRYMEQTYNVVTPSEIEPPRMTAHGIVAPEMLPDEINVVSDAMKAEGELEEGAFQSAMQAQSDREQEWLDYVRGARARG